MFGIKRGVWYEWFSNLNLPILWVDINTDQVFRGMNMMALFCPALRYEISGYGADRFQEAPTEPEASIYIVYL